MNLEITSEPGLIDPDTDEVTLASPYAGAATDFLLTVGPDSLVGKEFRLARQESTSQATEAPWWRALKKFFAPEYHNVVDVVEQRIELTAYWLAVPRVAGAKAKLATSEQHSTGRVMSFTIAGIGGGPKFTATVKDGIGYTATESQRASLSTNGRVQIVEVVRDGLVIDRYPRLIALTSATDDWEFPAITTAPSGTIKHSTNYRLVGATEDTTVDFTISEGTELKGSLGLKLESAGIDISTEMTVGYTRDATITTTLPPGHDYEAIRYSGVEALFWTP